MSDLPLTPFTKIIESAASRDYSWFDFNGYKFAEIVRDTVTDVSAGRSGVAFQDVSPMMKFLIKGPDAGPFLDYIATRKLSHLKPGRVAYFLMVSEDGYVRDDGTAFRLSNDEFIIESVSNLVEWLEGHSTGFDVTITDVQSRWAQISIYGKGSAAFLKDAGIKGLESLKPFNFIQTQYSSSEFIVSRTGFSGGLGYELIIPWDEAEATLQEILRKGGSDSVTFTGNYTGVTLRLDIGFLIPGWDFPVPGVNAETDPTDLRTPYDMGWDWLVQLDNRDHFVGKSALIRIAEHGPRFNFFALIFDSEVDPKAITGSSVFDGSGREIGAIFTGGYSATIGKHVGFCNVEAGSVAAGDSVLAGEDKAGGKLSDFPLIDVPERGQTPPPGL